MTSDNKFTKLNPCSVDSVSPRDMTIRFLTDTKVWDNNKIEKDYYLLAESATDITKLINNVRVYISRIRGSYRLNGRKPPQFTFTSKAEQVDKSETNLALPEGISLYKVSLGKANTQKTQAQLFVEQELL